MCPSFLPVLYLISQSVVLPPTPSVPFFSASEPNGLLGLGSRPSTDVAAVPTLGCCMKPQVLRGAESFLRDFYYVQLTGHERPLTSAVTAGGCGESHRYYQVRSRRMRVHGRGPCSPELQTCPDKRHGRCRQTCRWDWCQQERPGVRAGAAPAPSQLVTLG